jgi:hypothetical protein
MMNIDDMTKKQLKEYLERIIGALDELDGEDYFGTEGWKHYLGIEE